MGRKNDWIFSINYVINPGFLFITEFITIYAVKKGGIYTDIGTTW